MLCLFCLGVETLQKVLFIQRLLRSFTHEIYASQAQTKTGRCMAMQETSFQLCTKYMVTLPESLGVRGCQPSLIPSLFLLGNESVDEATTSHAGWIFRLPVRCSYAQSHWSPGIFTNSQQKKLFQFIV